MIPSGYPDEHPDVICLTDIYHPNVDIDVLDEHNICLNLFDEWNRSFGLEDCIQGLLFLLYQPNLSDPISGFFNCNIDWDTFEHNVQKSLNGECVDGYSFAKNHGYENRDYLLNSIIREHANDDSGIVESETTVLEPCDNENVGEENRKAEASGVTLDVNLIDVAPATDAVQPSAAVGRYDGSDSPPVLNNGRESFAREMHDFCILKGQSTNENVHTVTMSIQTFLTKFKITIVIGSPNQRSNALVPRTVSTILNPK